MKKIKLNIKILSICLFVLSSCSDVLDKVPLNSYSDGTVWADINLSDYYLNFCYRSCLNFRAMTLSGVSDECMFIHIKGTDNYLLGNINADNTAPWIASGTYSFMNYSWLGLYPVIQKINIFIANIDKVPNNYEGTLKTSVKEQVDRMKGEALFLRAFCYSQLCRTYGGVPIFKIPNELGQDFLAVKRATFEETVNFIVEDCDEAAKLLKVKSQMEMGRATKEAALALKSRILLFAASDLTADGTAESELVGYKNPNRTTLWTAAKNAAKAVMDLGTCELANFGAPDKNAVATNYYNFFRAYDLSSKEVIWGKMYSTSAGDANKWNLRNANNGNECYGSHSPTASLVDEYEMADGTKFFDHFEINSQGYYVDKKSASQNKNIYYNREPRFYGSILYDSAIWQPRIYPAIAAIDPLGIYDRRTRKTIKADGSVVTRVGIDTRSGPVDKGDGSYTGYLFKKMLDHTIAGYYNSNQNVWIELRYAEVIMNFAEACLGLGDTQTAATYINMIRNRAALPNFTGNITEALRHERRIEFALEEFRFFDIRRWKILDQVITNAMGVDIVETTNQSTGTVLTTWQLINAQKRGPVSKKMYWIPIPTSEINKAPQLVQNPNY
jgi:hypothetical protein